MVLGPLHADCGQHARGTVCQSRGKLDANLRVTLLAAVLTLVPTLLYLVHADPAAGHRARHPGVPGRDAHPGPYNAALQIVTHNQMRGQVTALFLFVFNIVGFGLRCDDRSLAFTNFVFGDENMLRYSLAATAAVMGA